MCDGSPIIYWLFKRDVDIIADDCESAVSRRAHIPFSMDIRTEHE